MANKESEIPNESKSIEELKVIAGVTDTVFNGVKAAENWTTGKAVTSKEFDAAIERFLKSPIKKGR